MSIETRLHAVEEYLKILQTKSQLDYYYPVGSYYETSDASFDPNTAWGGTWVRANKGDKVLFSGDTSGDITLAETVTNFEYITIFFRDNDNIYDSTNLAGNNLAIALSLSHTDYGTTQFYVKTKTFSVKDNTIKQQKNGNTVIRNAQVYVRGGAFYQGDYIYIVKVVGRNRINGAWHRTA